jgi:hypothetical protein
MCGLRVRLRLALSRQAVPTESDAIVTAIRRSVVQAFSAIARPTDHELAPHDCWECVEVRRRLSPHSFESVPDADLDWLRDSLPLLGPKGLHYYLPAYVLRSLRECNWDGIEFLIYHLAPTPISLAERADYWRDRLQLFSAQERKTILSFLDWLESSSVGREYKSEIVAARGIWSNDLW